jgi:DNA end-binding protein Ku
VAEEPEGGAQIIDLMEALRASLEKRGGKERAAAPAAGKATKAARKPAKKAEAPAEAEAPKRKAAKRAK